MFSSKNDLLGEDGPPSNRDITSQATSSHSITQVMAPSLHDSAYVTSDQQSVGTIGPVRNEIRSSQGAAIGNGEFFFEKETDQRMGIYFVTVSTLLERLFFEYLRKRCPKFKSIVMELRVLGRSEAEATTRLMVYCPPSCYKRARKFFKTKDAQELCEPYDKTIPRLKAFVFGCAAEPVSGNIQMEACASSDTLSCLTTFCGVPLVFTDTSCRTSPKAMRTATLGGVVKVVHEDHSSAFYGITAKHAIEECRQDTEPGDGADETDWGNDESAQESDSESLYDTQDEDGFLPADSGAKRRGRSSGPPLDGAVSMPWDFSERTLFGQVADIFRPSNQEVERKLPSHDWALLKLDSTKPNEFCTTDYLGVLRTQPLLVTSQPNFHDGLSDPITMISGSHGPQAGELFSNPTRLLLGTSKVFVNAYRLTLNNGNGTSILSERRSLADLSLSVCNGDSGAWVVHSNSPEVYGFVVARNHFGDAYAVSIIEAFEDIKACTNARMVALPTIEEMRAGYIEEPFKTNRSVVVNSSGCYKSDDIGSETTEATLITDPVASIAEQLFSSPHVPPIDTVKCRTLALPSNTTIGWNDVSAENDTRLGHPMEQITTKTTLCEPRVSGQLASKRKPLKERLTESPNGEASLIDCVHDVRLSNSLGIGKGKTEDDAGYGDDKLPSPTTIRSSEFGDIGELGASSDQSSSRSKNTKKSTRASMASIICSISSTSTERLDSHVSGRKHVGKNKKKKRRPDEKSTVTNGSGLSKSTRTDFREPLESVPNHLDQMAVPKCSRGVFAKEWSPSVAAPYRFCDEVPFVQTRRGALDEDLSNNDNGISILFRDFDDGISLVQVIGVEDFCSNVSLDVLGSGSGPAAGVRRGAWLDDRYHCQQFDKRLFRNHENPLTATALYRALKKPVSIS